MTIGHEYRKWCGGRTILLSVEKDGVHAKSCRESQHAGTHTMYVPECRSIPLAEDEARDHQAHARLASPAMRAIGREGI